MTNIMVNKMTNIMIFNMTKNNDYTYDDSFNG